MVSYFCTGLNLSVPHKAIAGWILLLAFSMQDMYRSVLVADYFINTEKYAQNCENKAKPSLHCAGKCQLMKKLREEDRKEQENPERKQAAKNEIVVLFSVSHDNSLIPIPENSIRHRSVRQDGLLPGRTHDVFHPPRIREVI